MGYVPQLDPAAAAGPIQIDGSITIDDIVEGDLIFTSRPGLLQDLCNRAGEPWRHVGIATVNDGVTSITEVSRTRYDVRPMDKVLASNHEVAVARIEPDRRPLAVEAADWCGRHFGQEQIYAWHDVMLAGMITTARHYSLVEERETLHRAIEAAAGVVGSRRPQQGEVSYTCAAFIAEAFASVGCPLEFDLRVPRAVGERPGVVELIKGRNRTQLRANRPTTREYGVVLYALLAGMMAATSGSDPEDDPSTDAPSEMDQFRWAMPGDIWRSPSVVDRFIVLPDTGLSEELEQTQLTVALTGATR